MTVVKKFFFVTILSACPLFLSGCQTTAEAVADGSAPVLLPYIKNTSNECYFLDEFMPTPNSMVRGKTGSLNLRYYLYKSANYKDWQEKPIILSFYSQDDHCWSLFEEYYVKD